jgi:hypothetical protein
MSLTDSKNDFLNKSIILLTITRNTLAFEQYRRGNSLVVARYYLTPINWTSVKFSVFSFQFCLVKAI